MHDVAELSLLTFEAVPEIGREAAPWLLDKIKTARQQRLASFGAFVVRGVDFGFISSFMNELVGDWKNSLTSATFYRSSEQPLHRDNGLVNSVTAHLTEEGRAKALFLIGSKMNFSTLTYGYTHDLFEEKTVPPLVTAPNQALQTELNKGDAVIFDHTQPHAFRSLDAARESISIFQDL